jgi:hypothetical protein
MKLTKITARAFKGLDFTLDLNDINFLVGSNFSGKTARTDAIRFLLLGYLPELGKTAVATFGLASGREMVVEGTFENGQTIRRRRYLSGDSVKTDDSIPEDIEKYGQLAIMLNAETYFELSPKARVEYVFANVQMGQEWTSDGIIEKLALVFEPFKNTHAIGELKDFAAEASGPQQFVDNALAWLEAEAKSAKDYATQMEKTTQGITNLKLNDQVGRRMELIDSDIFVANARLRDAQAEKARLKAIYDLSVGKQTRRAALVRQIDSGKGLAGQIEALQAELIKANATLEEFPVVTPAQLDQIRKNGQVVANAITEQERQLKELMVDIGSIKSDMLDIKNQTQCPYCGATGEGWKQIKLLEWEAEVKKNEAHLCELEKTLPILRQKRQVLVTEYTTANKDQSARLILEGQIQRRNNELKDLTSKASLIAAYEEELAGIPDTTAVTNVNPMAEANNAVDMAVATLSNLEMERRASGQAEQDKKRLAEAETNRDKAKEDSKMYAAATKRMREIQGEMVAAAFAPLLQTANSFFGTILKTPIAYHDEEIGTWRNGVWVTHRTLSGTEKALTYAAIQAALASTSPVRIMMLDELGRLDTANIDKLINVMEHLCPGSIDQFIGIDATNRYHHTFNSSNLTVTSIA